MQDDSASDPVLKRIDLSIRLHLQPPSQGITAAELVNAIFLTLGQTQRDDLVDDVARMIPESAKGDLHRVVEAILRPGATYTPFTIGRPSDPQAWRQSMIPVCQKLAALFRLYLENEQRHRGSTDSLG
jgi:hypothetical protein